MKKKPRFLVAKESFVYDGQNSIGYEGKPIRVG
jgi:hypothetical protein